MDAIIAPWADAIAGIKRLKMLDTERRQKLCEVGLVSTPDMYILGSG